MVYAHIGHLENLTVGLKLPLVVYAAVFLDVVHLPLLLPSSTSLAVNSSYVYFWYDVYLIHVCLCERYNRLHKDVALVSLSNILHQVHYSDEAAIVIHAAIDISRELAISYFTLGNIYAVILWSRDLLHYCVLKFILTRCHAVAGTTARCALYNECTNPNPATNLIPVHNLQ